MLVSSAWTSASRKYAMSGNLYQTMFMLASTGITKWTVWGTFEYEYTHVRSTSCSIVLRSSTAANHSLHGFYLNSIPSSSNEERGEQTYLVM